MKTLLDVVTALIIATWLTAQPTSASPIPRPLARKGIITTLTVTPIASRGANSSFIVASGTSGPPAVVVARGPGTTTAAVPAPNPAPAPVPTISDIVPPSPYAAPGDCPKTNAPYFIGQYPGSPFVAKPFQDLFAEPKELPVTGRVCRADDGHCLLSYEIDIQEVQARPFDNAVPGCRSQGATWFMTYGGTVPSPTITVPAGHETLVRFNNKISGRYFPQNKFPCNTVNRTGRPCAVHNHGAASLAPFDGWAEDVICGGETKDHVYPNNRPVTGWYHDHALHVTADNANSGMAGFYIVSAKVKHGGCGEPWNLEDVETKLMMLGDKVIDSTCQIYMDHAKAHLDDYYGDINLVNGIPWPTMPLQGKFYRFRLLNAALSRTYYVSIRNASQADISSSVCKIIAKDGGFRSTPANFPADGLYLGVGERYEVVCDFTAYAGQTLYWWNGHDFSLLKPVPYFCYSHLIAKMTISSVPVGNAPAVNFSSALAPPRSLTPMLQVLNQTDIDAAYAMVNNGKFHRVMKFGKDGAFLPPQWTINGETWDSFSIAATDVGQNTWEVWKFTTGGGWYHPIHLHLVDMFMLRRDGGLGTIRPYELWSPADMVLLGPSEDVYVLIRFGAHKGGT